MDRVWNLQRTRQMEGADIVIGWVKDGKTYFKVSKCMVVLATEKKKKNNNEKLAMTKCYCGLFENFQTARPNFCIT